MSDFSFEDQRRTFHTMRYAADPSVDPNTKVSTSNFIGESTAIDAAGGDTMMTKKNISKSERRKLKSKLIELRTGMGSARPSDEQFEQMAAWANTADQKAGIEGAKAAAGIAEGTSAKSKDDTEKTTLHIKDEYDYLGRTYMHPRQDLGERLGVTPEKCFLPKANIYTWSGHTKGVQRTQFLPNTGHLMLSCSMDSKIKLWEFYGERRLLRTFHGHTQAVRDISFNRDGSRFVSCGYDKVTRLWDTETGQCIARYKSKKITYCVKFHPDADKQHLFVAGDQNKMIITRDTNTGEVVQEYDRHLGSVNSITFVEDGKRMVTTSDDKSIRVWEWDIPVDIKYIADPGLH